MSIVYASLDAQLILEPDDRADMYGCTFVFRNPEHQRMRVEVTLGTTQRTLWVEYKSTSVCVLAGPGNGEICTVTFRGHSPLRLIINNAEAVSEYMKAAV